MTVARDLHQQYLRQEIAIKQLLSGLIDCYLSNNEDERNSAIEILGSIEHPEAVRELILMFQDCQWRATKLFLVDVIGQHPSNRGTEFLIHLAKGGNDIDMRKAAITALGKSQKPEARRFLCAYYPYVPASLWVTHTKNLPSVCDNRVLELIAAKLCYACENQQNRQIKVLLIAISQTKNAGLKSSLVQCLEQFPQSPELVDEYCRALGNLSRSVEDLQKINAQYPKLLQRSNAYKIAWNRITNRLTWTLPYLIDCAMQNSKDFEFFVSEIKIFPSAQIIAKLTDILDEKNTKIILKIGSLLSTQDALPIFRLVLAKIPLNRQLIFELLNSVMAHHTQDLEDVLTSLKARCLKDFNSPLFAKWFEAIALCLPNAAHIFTEFFESAQFKTADPKAQTAAINACVSFCQVSLPDTAQKNICIEVLKNLLFSTTSFSTHARVLRALGQLEYFDRDLLEYTKSHLHDEKITSSALFLLERACPPEANGLCLDIIVNTAHTKDLVPSIFRALSAQVEPPAASQSIDTLLKRSLSKESYRNTKLLALKFLGKYRRKEFLANLIHFTQEDIGLQLAAVVALRNFADESAIEALCHALESKSIAVAGRAADSLMQISGLKAGIIILEYLENHINNTELCEKVIRCFNLEAAQNQLIRQNLSRIISQNKNHKMIEGFVFLYEKVFFANRELSEELSNLLTENRYLFEKLAACLENSPKISQQEFQDSFAKSKINCWRIVYLLMQKTWGENFLNKALHTRSGLLKIIDNSGVLDDETTTENLVDFFEIENSLAKSPLFIMLLKQICQTIRAGHVAEYGLTILHSITSWAALILMFGRFVPAYQKILSPEEKQDFPFYPSNSAKVMQICLDILSLDKQIKEIEMANFFPQKEQILSLCALLDNICQQVAKDFPELTTNRCSA